MKLKQILAMLLTVALTSATFTACSDDENFIAVTGVSLNKTTLSIAAGSTATLTATVAPTDATNKNVTWSSSNAAIAKVDAFRLSIEKYTEKITQELLQLDIPEPSLQLYKCPQCQQ